MTVKAPSWFRKGLGTSLECSHDGSVAGLEPDGTTPLPTPLRPESSTIVAAFGDMGGLLGRGAAAAAWLWGTRIQDQKTTIEIFRTGEVSGKSQEGGYKRDGTHTVWMKDVMTGWIVGAKVNMSVAW